MAPETSPPVAEEVKDVCPRSCVWRVRSLYEEIEPVVEPVVESSPSQDTTPAAVDEKVEESTPTNTLEDALPIVAGAVAAIAVGVMAAEVLSNNKVTEKAIVEEPEQLPGVPEEPSANAAPASPKSDKDKRSHRSSRHSRSSYQSSSREIPHEERPQRRRRESEGSLKAVTPPQSSPKLTKPTRHDSGVSAVSTSSGRHRRDRTVEEQAAHEKRKEERRLKAKQAETSKTVPVPSESVVVDDPISEAPMPGILRRMSTSRRHSISKSQNTTVDGDKRPKLLDLKGSSIVKAPFLASDKPHVKEVIEKIRAPPVERPRAPVEQERPKLPKKDSSSHHQSSRSHRREREESDAKRVEADRDARRARRESDRALEAARAADAEEAQKQRDKEEEERRLRREERRRKRAELEAAEKAAEEKVAEEARAAKAAEDADREQDVERVRGSEGVRSKERVHRHRHRREKEKEKPKGPLNSLWSSAKKVFG